MCQTHEFFMASMEDTWEDLGEKKMRNPHLNTSESDALKIIEKKSYTVHRVSLQGNDAYVQRNEENYQSQDFRSKTSPHQTPGLPSAEVSAFFLDE